MKSDKSYNLCIEKMKVLKKYTPIQWLQKSYKIEWILHL